MKIAVDYLTFHELAPTLDFEKYVLPGIRQERTKLFLYEYTVCPTDIGPTSRPNTSN